MQGNPDEGAKRISELAVEDWERDLKRFLELDAMVAVAARSGGAACPQAGKLGFLWGGEDHPRRDLLHGTTGEVVVGIQFSALRVHYDYLNRGRRQTIEQLDLLAVSQPC